MASTKANSPFTFKSSTSAFGATLSQGPVTANKAFNTTRNGADKHSAAVRMIACHYDEETKSIKVFCNDGKLRECRIERLANKKAAQALWAALKKAGTENDVVFVAAGGFSPDRWFYTVL